MHGVVGGGGFGWFSRLPADGFSRSLRPLATIFGLVPLFFWGEGGGCYIFIGMVSDGCRVRLFVTSLQDGHKKKTETSRRSRKELKNRKKKVRGKAKKDVGAAGKKKD